MKVFIVQLYKPFLLAMFGLNSCELNTPSVNLNYVRISKETTRLFESHNVKFATTIYINSGGGVPTEAAKIANVMLKKELSIIVTAECISACAEFLLPAASTIGFKNEPIIGFHWGPMMNRALLERHTDKSLSYCSWIAEVKQRVLYENTQHNPNFWQTVLQKLNLAHYRVVYKDKQCPWHVKSFKNHLWLPTSKQLREGLGLKFIGSVCADDFDKCTKKIDRRWRNGTRIVVGDEIYISRGAQ